MPSDRRAAVIGAAGFIGGALVRTLTDRGRRPAVYTRSIPFLAHDGTPDPGLLAADTVFWLASSIRPATAGEPAAAATDRDHLARLLDALDRAGRSQARVVAVSSGGTVYDPASPPPHSESSPLAPANEYGAAMLDIEALVRNRARHGAVLRVGNAYGPGQVPRRGQGVIAHWLAAIAADTPVRVIGSDQVARDYVFVDDVVDALIRVHDAPEAPSVVNIGSGRPTSLADLLEHVRRTVAPHEVTVVRDDARGFDAPSTWLDISLAERLLDWQPRVDLADGLERTWRAVLAAGHSPLG